MTAELRSVYDLIIVGGGVAGCVLASAVQRLPGLSVLLIEAGLDYGPRRSDWPAGILDARELPREDLWDPGSAPHAWRGKVLGGSSCVNGCWHTWGADSDYDEWAEAAGPTGAALTALALEPHRAAATRALRVRPVTEDETSLWSSASVAGAQRLGYQFVEDLAGRTAGAGVGLPPINAIGDQRWNAAFGYLADCRSNPELDIFDRATVQRLDFSGPRVTGVLVRQGDQLRRFSAATVVLTAGAFGSPAVLMRSGIGNRRQLIEDGVTPLRELPGVGANLSDHPGVTLRLSAAGELRDALAEIEQRGKLYASQVALKAVSSVCPTGSDASQWDLHLLPTAGAPLFDARTPGEFEVGITAFLMKPRSRGSVRLNCDGDAEPDQDYLSDPGGHDVQALADGVELARELAATPELARLAAVDSVPDLADRSPAGLALLRASLGTYWHPVGTCALGTDPDRGAVIDARGRVHGFDNLLVADASILPSTPRANTQLSVLAVASMLADQLVAELR
ncbi:MAG: GMC family oxidoreductase [Jatrophihabitantaceae bacterium]